MLKACASRTTPASFIEAPGGPRNPDKPSFLASKQVERRLHVVGIVTANPMNATLNVDEAVGTILNDDPPPPFSITSFQWLGADLHIYFGAAAGALYRVERSDDLVTNFWTTVADNIQGTGATVESTDPNASTRP